MNAGSVFRFILALVVVAGIALLALGTYQAGVAAGLAADGASGTPVPYYGWGPGWGPGFGFFGFFGFLFFLILLFALFRAATWGGRGRGYGGPGRWGTGPNGSGSPRGS